MGLMTATTRAFGILLVTVSVATVTSCTGPSTSSATSSTTTDTTSPASAPASSAGTTIAPVPASGTVSIRGRALGTTDVPTGFHPTVGGDLDKATAMEGNTVDGAGPILESGFRAGREMRWTNGSDTIYQLVIEFDESAGASSYFELSASDKDKGPAEGLPKSRVFEGSDEAKGSHWVSILIAQDRFIAVTQYSSRGNIDPTEAARKLSQRESELLEG